jgi:hypothetical protein
VTKAALLKKLEKCVQDHDTESAHADADDALIEFINDEEIAAVYARVPKWYA